MCPYYINLVAVAVSMEINQDMDFVPCLVKRCQ